MNELAGWIIVFGLAFAAGCSFMLSGQIEQRSRESARVALQSNEMTRARLERLADSFSQSPEPTLGVVLEFRRSRRGGPSNTMDARPGHAESNQSSRRPIDEFLSA